MGDMYLKVGPARKFCEQVFQAAGLDAKDSAIVTDNLISADLRGLASHGISRVRVYIDRLQSGQVNRRPNIKLLTDKPGLLHIDGDNGLGAVIGVQAMDLCIERAGTNGACVCSVQRANHFGIASFYTMRAVRKGMIGIAASNNPPNMAPWGGITPMIGTNPFSIAAPAKKHKPLLLDMSSSIVARGKINVAEIEGRPIPEGWAIDREGRPTTNATEALRGSVLPFGQHKGYGIALMVDMFAGILSGAAFSNRVGQLWGNKESIQDIGLYFSVINPGAAIGSDTFAERVDELIDDLKASKPVPGTKEVLVPGEIEFANEERNSKRGLLVGPGVLKDLESLRTDYGLSMNLADHLVSP